MANQIETKKITTLTENTDLSDTDQFPFGAGGGSGLRRIKWINIWNKILAKMRAAIIVNNCTTTVAGYALDARQGKIIQDEVSELNTKIDDCNRPNIAGITNNIGHGSTVPADGIVCLCFGVTGNCDCSVNVNNTKVARIRWRGGSAPETHVFPVTFPVPKGANITVSGLDQSVSVSNGMFIPYYA